MGPRSIDRGITAATKTLWTANGLQWGRDQLIAELTQRPFSPLDPDRFNGAAIN